MNKRDIDVIPCDHGHRILFAAMASPCEVIVEDSSFALAKKIAQLITDEVWRIEDKYSRYNPNSLCSAINRSDGKQVTIDAETYAMLAFADQCFELSNGKFDITSGVLRRAWHFDGSDNIPADNTVKALLPCIGWKKINYSEHHMTLPKGMEIDFGGIGKEYAVDKVTDLIRSYCDNAALINFGGDLAVTSARKSRKPWQVGIDLQGLTGKPNVVISFQQGAIATSGDANRYLMKNNKRYSHILNPITGYPVEHAPSSVTVASSNCLNAGLVATLAMLAGESAEQFLVKNEFKHWIFRE